MNRQRPCLEYRLAVTATDPDPAQRLACISPARRALRSAALGWGINDTVLDDLVAIAAELISNAARHNDPGTVHATLRVTTPGDRLRLEVADAGRRMPRPAAAFGDGQAEAGRGLLMVSALADCWGATPTPTGKNVWAELALPNPPDIPAVTRQGRRAAAITELVAASRLRALLVPLSGGAAVA